MTTTRWRLPYKEEAREVGAVFRRGRRRQLMRLGGRHDPDESERAVAVPPVLPEAIRDGVEVAAKYRTHDGMLLLFCVLAATEWSAVAVALVLADANHSVMLAAANEMTPSHTLVPCFWLAAATYGIFAAATPAPFFVLAADGNGGLAAAKEKMTFGVMVPECVVAAACDGGAAAANTAMTAITPLLSHKCWRRQERPWRLCCWLSTTTSCWRLPGQHWAALSCCPAALGTWAAANGSG